MLLETNMAFIQSFVLIDLLCFKVYKVKGTIVKSSKNGM
jgi:hypothetical protein